MLAALHGHEDYLSQLVSSGCNIDAQDHDGCTAAMHAVERDQHGTLCQLIAAGCDVELKNNLGQTALMLATQKAHLFCVDMLVAATEYRTLQLALAETPMSDSSIADRTTRARL
jgi:ankyrin repeat protein